MVAISQQKIHDPPSHRIFVFGSNMGGRHGKGVALHASVHYGAQSGVGIGHMAQCFAIPTKDQMLRTLSLSQIEHFIGTFKAYAKNHPNLQFNVTKIGCGLAGYKDEQIAPLFRRSPDNCWFDPTWEPWLGADVKYWDKRP